MQEEEDSTAAYILEGALGTLENTMRGKEQRWMRAGA